MRALALVGAAICLLVAVGGAFTIGWCSRALLTRRQRELAEVGRTDG